MGFCSDGCSPKRRVFPGDCGDCGSEQEMFDQVASEQARLAGTPFRIYSLRRAKHRDPLYGEPSRDGKEWVFQGPFEMMGAIEFSEATGTTTDVTENGTMTESEATLQVSRKEFEDREAPEPKRGDVIEFWYDRPFGEPGYQWDVVGSDTDGEIWSTERFTLWIIKLKKRTKFLAFRKTDKEHI